MATTPEHPETPPEQTRPAPAAPQPAAPVPPPVGAPARPHEKAVHQVVFVSYPKLLFIWPLILAGFVFWPLGRPATAPASAAAGTQTTGQSALEPGAQLATQPARAAVHRLEILGWLYLWIAVLVGLTVGVDVGRNQAAFWVLLVAALYVLGIWLRDVKGFTLFGDIYRWFGGLDVQYDRSLGLALSIILLVPYVIMLVWGYFNDRWKITHNEFEHHSFGRQDDSLGRGAKTVRTMYPDVFEMLLGLAGTLIVYNASGTKELRRISHVTCLPLVRKRLNKILERTAITTEQTEDEEDDENA